MPADPILPRPVVLNRALIFKWLGPKSVKKLRDAGAVQSGRRLMVEAVEEAIRAKYPDGQYPPVEELLGVDDA